MQARCERRQAGILTAGFAGLHVLCHYPLGGRADRKRFVNTL
jgi:hypothetical protein